MIAVLGAGAFGTALAVALAAAGRRVRLIARDAESAAAIAAARANPRRLPGVDLPPGVEVTAATAGLGSAEAVLLSVPMQDLGPVLARAAADLGGAPLVACCKGIERGSLRGPSAVIAAARPDGPAAVLTGPAFAADIARGLPTALTLACADAAAGAALQRLLSTPALRLYRTADVTGAELGGALKNVIALAAGAAAGAGLGESARAAVITRGHAEMRRLARALGARAETLAGLSGLGDLVLSATSERSRNYRRGLALGAGRAWDEDATVEGAATAVAAADLARRHGIEMPLTETVAGLLAGRLTPAEAMRGLLSRPLREE
jgi:glycerol-3-phosphate dehydrogenase (NAD(P)+)